MGNVVGAWDAGIASPTSVKRPLTPSTGESPYLPNPDSMVIANGWYGKTQIDVDLVLFTF